MTGGLAVRGLVVLAGLVLASAAQGACKGLARAPGEPVARSLVIVVADTLRRDRTGIYGGPARTPHFDRFASAHWLFEQAASRAPWTKPAIATLFTSLYPSQHRVASDPQLQGAFGKTRSTEVTAADVLSASYRTLAEVFRDAGAWTGPRLRRAPTSASLGSPGSGRSPAWGRVGLPEHTEAKRGASPWPSTRR